MEEAEREAEPRQCTRMVSCRRAKETQEGGGRSGSRQRREALPLHGPDLLPQRPPPATRPGAEPEPARAKAGRLSRAVLAVYLTPSLPGHLSDPGTVPAFLYLLTTQLVTVAPV